MDATKQDQYASIQDVIRQMIAVSGNSISQTSRNIGRSSRYLSSMLANKTMPSVELFAKIAGACGFGLFAVKLDDENDGGENKPLMLAVCMEESQRAMVSATLNKEMSDMLDQVNELLAVNEMALTNEDLANKISRYLHMLMNVRDEKGITPEERNTQDDLVQKLLNLTEPYTTRSAGKDQRES